MSLAIKVFAAHWCHCIDTTGFGAYDIVTLSLPTGRHQMIHLIANGNGVSIHLFSIDGAIGLQATIGM